MRRPLSVLAAVVFLGAVCFIAQPVGRTDDAKKEEKPLVTFSKDVAPIFFKNCVQCHRPGEIAPMSLLSYKEARPWARSIKEKVVTGDMPPWHADPHYGEFVNDRRLSQKDVETISQWVEQGAVEGNPKDMPAAPVFLDGWNIGKPDAIFYLPEEFAVPSEGEVPYKYFNVPTNFKEDMWVQAAEIRPGERSVVHHIIVFSQKGTERKLLAGYAPGEQPAIIPKGLGRKIPAGATLTFQVHYTPNGKATKDRSYIGLIFAKETPKHDIMTRPIMNGKFVIPPGNPSYKVESTYTFKEDVHIVSLMPHMHYRGKDFEYRITYPDGKSEVILSVPKYDFGWQSYYLLKQSLAAPKGTRIDCLAHFDNSARNRYNPDPTKEVRWGDQTWEEMMIGWISFTRDNEEEKQSDVATAGQSQ